MASPCCSSHVVCVAILVFTPAIGIPQCSVPCNRYMGRTSAQTPRVCLNAEQGVCGAQHGPACTNRGYEDCMQVYSSTAAMTISDVVYKTIGSRQLKLDIFTPPASQQKPVDGWPIVMHIHGGGWRKGGKGKIEEDLRSRVEAGHFAVVSVEYRLSSQSAGFPGSRVTAPAQIEDVLDAVRLFQSPDGGSTATSRQYGLNGARLACKGCSAGGHLCSLLATFGTNQCGVHMKAALDVSGPTNILTMDSDKQKCPWHEGAEHGGLNSAESDVLAHQVANILEHVSLDETTETFYTTADAPAPYPCLAHVVNLFNPVRWVNSTTTPPTYILHPTEDASVSCGQGVRLYDRLQRYGVPSEKPVMSGGHCDGYPTDQNAPAYDWLSNFLNARDMGGYYSSQTGMDWTTHARGTVGECLSSLNPAFTTCDAAGPYGWQVDAAAAGPFDQMLAPTTGSTTAEPDSSTTSGGSLPWWAWLLLASFAISLCAAAVFLAMPKAKQASQKRKKRGMGKEAYTPQQPEQVRQPAHTPGQPEQPKQPAPEHAPGPAMPTATAYATAYMAPQPALGAQRVTPMLPVQTAAVPVTTSRPVQQLTYAAPVVQAMPAQFGGVPAQQIVPAPRVAYAMRAPARAPGYQPGHQPGSH